MNIQISDIGHVIQLAIAPVFLLTGVGTKLAVLTNRLARIIEGLDNVARCHVLRYGDGSAHAHTWFVARTARLWGVVGSPVIEWDDVLPPGPERAGSGWTGTVTGNHAISNPSLMVNAQTY